MCGLLKLLLVKSKYTMSHPTVQFHSADTSCWSWTYFYASSRAQRVRKPQQLKYNLRQNQEEEKGRRNRIYWHTSHLEQITNIYLHIYINSPSCFYNTTKLICSDKTAGVCRVKSVCRTRIFVPDSFSSYTSLCASFSTVWFCYNSVRWGSSLRVYHRLTSTGFMWDYIQSKNKRLHQSLRINTSKVKLRYQLFEQADVTTSLLNDHLDKTLNAQNDSTAHRLVWCGFTLLVCVFYRNMLIRILDLNTFSQLHLTTVGHRNDSKTRWLIAKQLTCYQILTCLCCYHW